MTRLADPARCPDCRTPLAAGPLVCASCGLDLRGEPGTRLFALLTEADALIGRIRAGTAATPTTAGAAPGPTPAPVVSVVPPSGLPGPGLAAAARQGPTVSAATVPKLLLGLGALCVLVAASLFLPFAWSLLGTVGRTLVLVALTAAAGAGALAVGRRGLRASQEALGLVSLGLLVFDLLGARASGWLGDLSSAGTGVLVGATLVVAGTGATLALRRTAVGAFAGGEAAAVLGSGLVLLSGMSLESGTTGGRLAVVVPVLLALVALAAVLRRPDSRTMRIATAGHAVWAGTGWLALVAAAVGQLADGLSWGAMWPTGAGLLLLLAGAYAVAPALVPGVAGGARTAGLAAAVVPWTLAVVAPAFDEGATQRAVVVLGVVACCLVATSVVPRTRRIAVLPVGGLAALASTALVAPAALSALGAAGEHVAPVWGGAATDVAQASYDGAALGSPWLLPAVALVVGVGVVVLAGRLRDGLGVVVSLVCVAVAGALLLERTPLWVVVALLLAGAGATTSAAWVTDRTSWHVASLPPAAAALLLGCASESTTFAAALVLVVAAAAHHARGPLAVRTAAGSVLGPLLALAVASGATLAGAGASVAALPALVAVGGAVVVRGQLGRDEDLPAVELGAALGAVAATAVGVGQASPSEAATWLAVYLTVAGTAVGLVALTRPDRRALGWVAGLLLAGASWVRLADLGVDTPEAYTLPSAAALLVAGVVRTRRDRAGGTLTAWSPGLGLALVPSLLAALPDPLSWRAVLLGLACLVLVLGGAAARVAAPLVWGAGVGAVLVLWEVVPPALEMSAWLVIGVVGAALLVLGTSWERRVEETRSALGYLRLLR